ncbi:MAG: glycosyltransferase family 4 protein [Bacteroidota bacterium]
MKIALIHIRLMNKGGLETRLINYMNYFLDKGHEVTIITSKISGELSLPSKVNLMVVPLSIYPKFSRLLFFNYKLEKLLPTYTFDYVLSLERTWTQDHLIAPNTHIGYLKAQHKFFRDLSDLLQLYLDKKSFQTVKHIYACSQMVKDEIVQDYHIEPSKIKVVYPPLNTTKFNLEIRKNRALYQKKYGIDDTQINFCFVSTSHKRKGLELLINIFSSPENKHKHLYIAGSHTSYKQTNIHSLGFITEMHELYSAVDATLHPAIYEPFGQIISESIACGTYVMASDNVGAKEIILDKEIGLVLPTSDKKAWIDAVFHFNNKKVIEESLVTKIANELQLDSHMLKIFNG